ncbi:MAG: ATP-binding cassette domain-containing protein [candidate division Zixibacteria bacterium]|nr:ATP-binding cassette domain-containing protein [candidate division Zixibacteria bacterium]
MISVKNLTHSYVTSEEEIRSLNGINLQINAGEYVAIMGPNGSGKSTLAKIISGIVGGFSGDFSFDGVTVDSDSYPEQLSERVGMVFQNPDNQMVGMTVESELAFALENRALPPSLIRKRVDEVIEVFELERLLNRPPHTLSGGERQKLVIASVIIMEPEYLILDEPTSLLDPVARSRIMELIEYIYRGKGKFTDSESSTRTRPTIIHITQFAEEAQKGDRLIIFKEGKVCYDSTPDEVFAKALKDNAYFVSVPKLFKAQKLEISSVLDNSQHTGDDLREADESRIYEFSGIAYSYRLPWGETVSALKSVTGSIQKGSVIGAVGSTGSGKSTLAYLMAFLMYPDKGTVAFAGQTIRKSAPIELKRNIGMSFQFPEKQFFCDTVFDEIAFGLKLREESKKNIEHLVTDSLNMVGLTPELFTGRDPFSLSGGEKRRVGIAITLALEPDVLILDEPTSGLDGAGIDYLIQLIEKLRSESKTVFIISHNMEFLLTVCDRIMVFSNGEIAEDVSVPSILNGDCDLRRFNVTLSPYIEYTIEFGKSNGIRLKSLPYI